MRIVPTSSERARRIALLTETPTDLSTTDYVRNLWCMTFETIWFLKGNLPKLNASGKQATLAWH